MAALPARGKTIFDIGTSATSCRKGRRCHESHSGLVSWPVLLPTTRPAWYLARGL